MRSPYTGVRLQNAPIDSPEDSAPTKAAGAARQIRRSLSLAWLPICGCGKRVIVTGSSDRQTNTAAIANRMKPAGVSRRSNCCALASAARFTTMYTANTWPRRSGAVRSLSQLSITA